jgi:hypothetical protein
MLFPVVAVALADSYAPHDAYAARVTPVLISGNPNCGNVPSDLLQAIKVEPVQSGTFNFTALGMTHSVTLSNVREKSFDWTSSLGIDVVIVKGGPAANAYTYDPPSEALGDTDLVAPNDRGLSHVTFCYDSDPATDTPTPTPTDTPTPTPTDTPTPTPTDTPTPTPTDTPPPPDTPTPTDTPPPSATETPDPTETFVSEVLATAVEPTVTSEAQAFPPTGTGGGGSTSSSFPFFIALAGLGLGLLALGFWRYRLQH